MTVPFKHQSTARERSRGKEFFALFMEMGTGKSFADTLDTIDLVTDFGCDGWFIVAPKGTYANWILELDKHLPPEMKREVHLWTGGSSKREQGALDALCRQRKETLRVLVMNVEALSMSKRARMAASRFMASCRAAKMTVDESTCIKSPSAERTKACVMLGRAARWRRILTGMPVTKSPLDVFGQFEFLKEGSLGFRNFYSFRGTYAIMRDTRVGARKVQVVVNFRNLDDLRARIERHSYRVTKEECLDLPPKIYQMRHVELTDEQQRLYEKIRDEATVQLESGDHVTATEVMTQMLRMHQVLCGHVSDETGVVHDVPSNRFRDLLSLLEEASGKVIIWAPYRRTLDKIVAAIREHEEFGPQSVVQYDGSTSDEDRKIAIQRFQGTESVPHDENCRFFVGNPSTGGFGITLTRATTVVYFASGWSLEKRLQSEDRAHRHGQFHPVNIVDLIAPGTVEEKIVKTLRRGIDVASTIVGDAWREWVM